MKAGTSLIVLFSTLLILAVLGIGMGAVMMGPGTMGTGTMWGYGTPSAPSGWGWVLAMALGWAAMVVFWGALIAGLVLLVRWLVAPTPAANGAAEATQPIAILRRRYAAGEIDDVTYERMKRELAA